MSKSRQYLLSFTTLFLTKKGYVLTFNNHRSAPHKNEMPVGFEPWSSYSALVMDDIKLGTKVKRVAGIVQTDSAEFKTIFEGESPEDMQRGSISYLANITEQLRESGLRHFEGMTENIEGSDFYQRLGDVIEDLNGKVIQAASIGGNIENSTVNSYEGVETDNAKGSNIGYGNLDVTDFFDMLQIEGTEENLELMNLILTPNVGHNQVMDLADLVYKGAEESESERMMVIQYGHKVLDIAKANFIKVLLKALTGRGEVAEKVSNIGEVGDYSGTLRKSNQGEIGEYTGTLRTMRESELSSNEHFTKQVTVIHADYGHLEDFVNYKREIDHITLDGGDKVVNYGLRSHSVSTIGFNFRSGDEPQKSETSVTYVVVNSTPETADGGMLQSSRNEGEIQELLNGNIGYLEAVPANESEGGLHYSASTFGRESKLDGASAGIVSGEVEMFTGGKTYKTEQGIQELIDKGVGVLGADLNEESLDGKHVFQSDYVDTTAKSHKVFLGEGVSIESTFKFYIGDYDKNDQGISIHLGDEGHDTVAEVGKNVEGEEIQSGAQAKVIMRGLGELNTFETGKLDTLHLGEIIEQDTADYSKIYEGYDLTSETSSKTPQQGEVNGGDLGDVHLVGQHGQGVETSKLLAYDFTISEGSQAKVVATVRSLMSLVESMPSESSIEVYIQGVEQVPLGERGAKDIELLSYDRVDNLPKDLDAVVEVVDMSERLRGVLNLVRDYIQESEKLTDTYDIEKQLGLHVTKVEPVLELSRDLKVTSQRVEEILDLDRVGQSSVTMKEKVYDTDRQSGVGAINHVKERPIERGSLEFPRRLEVIPTLDNGTQDVGFKEEDSYFTVTDVAESAKVMREDYTTEITKRDQAAVQKEYTLEVETQDAGRGLGNDYETTVEIVQRGLVSKLLDVSVDCRVDLGEVESLYDVENQAIIGGSLKVEYDVEVERLTKSNVLTEFDIALSEEEQVRVGNLYDLTLDAVEDVGGMQDKEITLGRVEQTVTVNEYELITEGHTTADMESGAYTVMDTPESARTSTDKDVIVETFNLAEHSADKETILEYFGTASSVADLEVTIELPEESSISTDRDVTMEGLATADFNQMHEVVMEGTTQADTTTGVEVVIESPESMHFAKDIETIVETIEQADFTSDKYTVLEEVVDAVVSTDYDVVMEETAGAITSTDYDIVLEETIGSETSTDVDVVLEESVHVEVSTAYDTILEETTGADIATDYDTTLEGTTGAESSTDYETVLEETIGAETSTDVDTVLEETVNAEISTDVDTVLEMPEMAEPSNTFSDVVLEEFELSTKERQRLLDILEDTLAGKEGDNLLDIIEDGLSDKDNDTRLEILEDELSDKDGETRLEIIEDELSEKGGEDRLDIIEDELSDKDSETRIEIFEEEVSERSLVTIIDLKEEEQSEKSTETIIEFNEDDLSDRVTVKRVELSEEDESNRVSVRQVEVSGEGEGHRERIFDVGVGSEEEGDREDRVFPIDPGTLEDDDLGEGKLPVDPPWEVPDEPKNKIWLIMGKQYPAWNGWSPKKTR